MMVRIEPDDSAYPAVLREHLNGDALSCLYALGDAAILKHCLLGLICSVQCPGSIILKTLDAVRLLRDAGVAVAGGFHSPMERECLHLLLRGRAPVLYCAARGLAGLRLGLAAREAVKAGRLLALSPFDEEVKRITGDRARRRNEIVAALSREILIPHAVSGGKVWALAVNLLEEGRRVFTFDDAENADLIGAGATAVVTEALIQEIVPGAFP